MAATTAMPDAATFAATKVARRPITRRTGRSRSWRLPAERESATKKSHGCN
jgi:hypothetical protein